jgi:hypothetical protein
MNNIINSFNNYLNDNLNNVIGGSFVEVPDDVSKIFLNPIIYKEVLYHVVVITVDDTKYFILYNSDNNEVFCVLIEKMERLEYVVYKDKFLKINCDDVYDVYDNGVVINVKNKRCVDFHLDCENVMYYESVGIINKRLGTNRNIFYNPQSNEYRDTKIVVDNYSRILCDNRYLYEKLKRCIS